MTDKVVELDPPVDGGVVVGFDGSRASSRAVQVAADEAQLRGVPLHVLRAWMFTTAAAEAGAPVGTVPSLEEVEAAVRTSVEHAVQAARQGRPGLEVRGHVAHCKPSDALLAASETALVVVVSRLGQGGLVDRLLGSTADRVVRQARSSVLVVRP